MKSLENYLIRIYGKKLASLKITDQDAYVYASIGSRDDLTERKKIYFENEFLGLADYSAAFSEAEDFLMRVAPYLHFPRDQKEIWIPRLERMLDWIVEIDQKFPSLAHWTGIYLKEEALMGKKSSDLVLGPFLGDVTEHIRISIDRGICGMAVREERAVNVPDVTKVAEHIACSLKTKSELVIPLRNRKNEIVAELDLDSERLGAFTSDIESELKELAREFSDKVWKA
ncbi:MAG: GAF domain-containing protein [Oligoflexia bacterium]|nr:GAF domain-containing protein [Oligoflexia bacterium]